MATRENLDEMNAIYKFLKSKNIHLWKIMRFCPYRDTAKKNRSTLEITDAQFFDLKKKADAFFGINVAVLDINDVEQQYVISPAGNLMVGQNNEDLMLLPALYLQNRDMIKSVLKIKSKNEGK